MVTPPFPKCVVGTDCPRRNVCTEPVQQKAAGLSAIWGSTHVASRRGSAPAFTAIADSVTFFCPMRAFVPRLQRPFFDSVRDRNGASRVYLQRDRRLGRRHRQLDGKRKCCKHGPLIDQPPRKVIRWDTASSRARAPAAANKR